MRLSCSFYFYLVGFKADFRFRFKESKNALSPNQIPSMCLIIIRHDPGVYLQPFP